MDIHGKRPPDSGYPISPLDRAKSPEANIPLSPAASKESGIPYREREEDCEDAALAIDMAEGTGAFLLAADGLGMGQGFSRGAAQILKERAHHEVKDFNHHHQSLPTLSEGRDLIRRIADQAARELKAYQDNHAVAISAAGAEPANVSTVFSMGLACVNERGEKVFLNFHRGDCRLYALDLDKKTVEQITFDHTEGQQVEEIEVKRKTGRPATPAERLAITNQEFYGKNDIITATLGSLHHDLARAKISEIPEAWFTEYPLKANVVLAQVTDGITDALGPVFMEGTIKEAGRRAALNKKKPFDTGMFIGELFETATRYANQKTRLTNPKNRDQSIDSKSDDKAAAAKKF